MLVFPLNGAMRGFGLANIMITTKRITITIGIPKPNPRISPVFELVDVTPPGAPNKLEQLLRSEFNEYPGKHLLHLDTVDVPVQSAQLANVVLDRQVTDQLDLAKKKITASTA